MEEEAAKLSALSLQVNTSRDLTLQSVGDAGPAPHDILIPHRCICFLGVHA